MKRIFFFMVMLFALFQVNGQQKVEDIKTVLTWLDEKKEIEDHYFDTAYVAIQAQINATKNDVPTHAIWHSLMGTLLSNYFDENRYKIRNRTPVEDEEQADFKTWSGVQFEKQIHYHFQKSIEAKTVLQAISIENYAILMDTMVSVSYRPTLYDFLAHRALKFYIDYHFAEDILISDKDFFVHNPQFITLAFEPPQSIGYQYHTLKILQELTRLHLNSSSTLPIIDITLKRLYYTYSKCKLNNAKELYLNALLNLYEQYQNSEGKEDILCALGEFYYARGRNYNGIKDTLYRLDYKKAHDYYSQVIEIVSAGSIAENNAKARISDITKPSVNFSINKNIPVQQPTLFTVMYANCDSVYFRIIPVTEKQFDTLQPHLWGSRKIEKIAQLPYTHQFSFKTILHGDYREVTAHYILPKLPFGQYVVLASPNPFDSKENAGFCFEKIEVRSIMLSYRCNNSFYDFFTIDRITGEPVKNVELSLQITRLYKGESQKPVKLKTDAYGKASFLLKDNGKSQDITITIKRENESFEQHIVHYPVSEWIELEKISIFTDRNIYRPGQTVHYKLMVAQRKGKDSDYQAAAGYSGKIVLKGADYKKIEDIDFTTNEFGSFSGSFDIPQVTQTGQFNITVNRASVYFRVEEYKRPQFEVTVEQPKGSYKLEETVTVTGKAMAFAGYPIDGGVVKYQVTREKFLPFRSFWGFPNYSSSQETLDFGETVCDADGAFTISFTALSAPDDEQGKPIYLYRISADVTDINGETQSAATTVVIGSVSMAIQLEIPEIVEQEHSQNRFPLSAINLSGEKQPAIIEYVIIPLESPFHFKHDINQKTTVQLIDKETLSKTFPYLDLYHENDKENWKKRDAVATGKFNTATDSLFSIPNFSRLSEGYYRILLTTKDAYNEEIKYETTIFINQSRNSKCWTYKPILLTTDKTTARPGEDVTITAGTYIRDAKMWYEVIWNDRVIFMEWLSLHQEKISIIHTIPKNETGKLVIHTFLVKDNFVYSDNISIDVPDVNKKLDVEWITFRDKTMTGSEEQWQLKIKGKEGEKVMAEMLCSMYDASLDALYRKNSFFLPDYTLRKSYNYTFFYLSNKSSFSYYLQNNYSKWNMMQYRSYYQLKWANVLSNRYLFSLDKTEVLYEDTPPPVRFAEVRYSYTSNDGNFGVSYGSGAGAGSGAGYDADNATDFKFEINETATIAEIETATPPSLRSNFNETAFFYPHLLTDKEGNVSFAFTMPDALTRWDLQGIAHTKEMRNVIFEKSVISQKPLMVVPNAPRFFREGDTIFFSAKVVNLHDTEISGDVTLQLFNALTNEPLAIIADGETRTFTAKKGVSAQFSFKMTIPSGIEAITYRIFASGNVAGDLRFSDGEEKNIPVLPNRMLVTESLPFHVNGQEKKHFTFTKMKNATSSTLAHYKYTVEFTPNPVWYAILALPYIMEYPYDCNEQTFSRLYANTVASHIVNASPRIKWVFDNWQNLTPSTFCSNLEKNQELKNIVMEETPWVLEAQNQSERMQRIGILFDIKRMANEKNAAILKLKKNQNSDGGWAWFKGGYSNRYITQHIVAGFGQMLAMNVEQNSSETKSLLHNAIKFIDAQAQNEYIRISKMQNQNLNEYILNNLDVHYLYARSLQLNNQKLDKNSEIAYKFYLEQAKKQWDKHSIYEQGMLALAFYHSGEENIAEKVIANIKRRAQHDNEMGMYWKKEGAGWFWHEAPIERQALLIEAFATITKKDRTSVEKMQQWLLKQKQTQDWGNTKATAAACHALLLNGYELLEQPAGTVIEVGNMHLPAKFDTAEEATGYFKTTWSAEKITPGLADFTVEKSSDGIAWGAVYWQYFEDLDKITAAKTPLAMQKNLYLVTRTEQGETLTSISEDNPIAVGDRVRVRIVLKSDRDMEFVHLKDMRASAFEPVNVLSQYKHQGGLWYYESTRDAAVNFFFDYLPKGTYVFEYTLIATQSGTFSNGIGIIQSMYAPEFTSHSEGGKVVVSGSPKKYIFNKH